MNLHRLATSLNNTTDSDKRNLLAAIASNFAYVAQINKINTGGNNVTVQFVCQIMTDPMFGRAIDRIGVVTNLVLRERGVTLTYFNYSTMVSELSETSLKSSAATEGSRQWLFQQCTELGFFQTLKMKRHIFGNIDIPMDFYVNKCREVFGVPFTKLIMTTFIQTTDLIFGGLTPQVTNVISVQGSDDPWNVVGIRETIPNSVQAILIPGTAHCADLYESLFMDPKPLTQARLFIVQFLHYILTANFTSSSSSSINGYLVSVPNLSNTRTVDALAAVPTLYSGGLSSSSSSLVF